MMRTIRRFLAGLLLLGASLSATAEAAVTPTLHHKGFLSDKATNLPVNKAKDMEFRLFAQASGGAALWTEQRCAADGVPVHNGGYNVEVGSQTVGGIPASYFSDYAALWLEVRVDPDDDCAGFEALSPRTRLQASAFAFSALNTSTAASVASAGDALLAADTDANNSGDISLKTGVSERLRVLNSGRVGIGAASPAARLHVSSANAGAANQIFTASRGGSPGQEFFLVQGDGKVGIGTTTPTALLSVDGTMSVGSTLTVNGTLVATRMQSKSAAFIHIAMTSCSGGCAGNHTLSTWTDIAALGLTWGVSANTSPETFVHNGTGRITVNRAGTYLIRLHTLMQPTAATGNVACVCPSINGSANCLSMSSTVGWDHGYYPAGWWAQYPPRGFITNLVPGDTVGMAYYPAVALNIWAYSSYHAVEILRLD
ncbi:MAG: hypothetical protein WC969_14375 [Elusimicrobiota bacterium]|jgi:hypothetical protein